MGNFPVILVTLLVISAMLNHGTDAERIQACGSALTTMLSMACPGGFHGPQKRHHGHHNAVDGFESSDDEIKDIEGTEWWPYFVDRGQPGVMLRTRRGNKGVVDECCYKSCTFKELQQYCK